MILTSDKEWDPTTLDQDVTAEEITLDEDEDDPFQDARYDCGDGKFDRTGWYQHRKVQVTNRTKPSSFQGISVDANGWTYDDNGEYFFDCT